MCASSPDRSLDRRALLVLGACALLTPTGTFAQPVDPPLIAQVFVAGDRLWVEAMIDSKGPLLFCIDTGSTANFLRPAVSNALGLAAVGSHNVNGVGASRAYSWMVAGHDMVIGGRFTVASPVFQVYDFGDQLPPQAAGLLAATILTGADNELDFERGEWRMWPHGRREFAGLERLPSELSGEHPYLQPDRMKVTAKLDGKSYRLELDTGAQPGLLLFGGAVRRSGLFDEARPFAPQVTLGFGGAAARPSRVVRAKSFELGPLIVDRPLVSVMDPDQFNHLTGDGVVGLRFLEALTLATDMHRLCVWAARNGKPAPSDVYALFGVLLDRAAEGHALVATVGTGSPAAAAGLRTGDRIIDPPTFEVATQRTHTAVGQTVTLTIARGGETIPVSYTVRPWL